MKSFALLLSVLSLATAFQAATTALKPVQGRSSTICNLLPPNEFLPLTGLATTSTPTSSILLAEESWRQYVPLAVSLLVIVDILLGSPVANSILGVVRTPAELEGDEPLQVKTKGERIDSATVANEALEKARNAMEWQKYKEATKRDEDRMEELRKKMDKQLRELDEK